MKYKLLAIDLDGTLLNDAKQISPGNVEALRRYRSLGGQVVICSGRTPLSTRWVAEALGFSEPIICLNGSVTMDTAGKITDEHIFDNEQVLALLKLCREHDIYTHVYTDKVLFIPNECRWNKGWRDQNIPDLNIAGVDAARLEEYRKECRVEIVGDMYDFVASKQPRLLKMALFKGDGEILTFGEEIQKRIPELEISSSHKLNLEISPRGASKGNALRQLAARLEIQLAETAAIGDNYNDASMLQIAGLGVAMGNGPEDIRGLAGAVTDTNERDGVAQAIYNLVLNG